MAHSVPRNLVSGGPSTHEAGSLPPPIILTPPPNKSSSHSRKGSISRTSSMLKKRLSLSTFLKKRRQSSEHSSGAEGEQYPPLEPLHEGAMADYYQTVQQTVDGPPNMQLHVEQPFPGGWQHTPDHSRQPSPMPLTETRSSLAQQQPQSVHPMSTTLPDDAAVSSATLDQPHHLSTKPLPRRPHPTLHMPPPPPSPPLLPTKMANEEEQHQVQPHHHLHLAETSNSATQPPLTYFPTPAQSSDSSPTLHPTTASSCSPQAAVVSAPSSTAGSSVHATYSSSVASASTSAAASVSSLMLPPSDHGVSEMTIPEEEEEELETEGTEGHGSEQDGLSSLGGRSTHASDELEGEYHEHRPSQDMAMHAVEGGDDARRSKSKIKRGARKIKKWLTTSKSRSQDAAKAATTMAMVASPHSSTGKKMSISSHSSTLSSSSSLLAAGDDKVHPFQRLRRPSSQRDQDTTPPLESNLPSKDLRRESKALIVRPSSAAILPSQTNNIMVAHSNVPFPEFLPETRPRHTRSASLQTKNAVTLYNKGGPRRHSSQTFTSSTTTSSQISRRSLDSPEDQLRRSLQRIAHFNQRFRQLLPGPDQPCPPIRARSSSLPRSFSPALRPLAKSPSSSSPACNENSDNADGGEVDEREHGADASLERHCPKVRSPLSSGAAMAAAQFEQEYQMHLEAQAEHEQAVQEMKQKRRSVWVDIVDLELPESMPPSRSVVAKATTTPPTTPTVETASPPWHGPMYWNAEAATSLQSIPSMPSSSPANSRRNSLVSLHGDYEPENTLTDEYEIYQHDDEEEDEDISGDEYDYEYDDEEEEEGDEEDERSAYPPFMTKWDMEIASEDKQHTDDWIHQHADAHHRNDTTNQSHLSLPSTRRSSTIAESISTNDPMSPSARLTGFIQYKTMIPNNSNAALGKRFFWAMEAPSLLKPEANTNNNTNTDA